MNQCGILEARMRDTQPRVAPIPNRRLEVAFFWNEGIFRRFYIKPDHIVKGEDSDEENTTEERLQSTESIVLKGE